MRPLKLDRNPYLKEDISYFEKRREKLIEAKFRHLLYKLFKQKCPICEESLHNGEIVELHHINPRKSALRARALGCFAGGKYKLENIVPLHQMCHQQLTHGNQSLERFKIPSPAELRKKSKRTIDKP